MIFKLLDSLRKKPREVRQRVAFSTAVVFTLVVGGIWTMTLPARFIGNNNEVATSEGTKPFAGLVEAFREQFGMLKNQAGLIASNSATSTIATTTDSMVGTSSELINIEELLSSTTQDKPMEKTVPILIGTTSDSATVGQ